MRFRGFGDGATRFYEELAANNTREWWRANKHWYESDVREPLEHLLDDLRAEFGEAKVFRPNRDTRFSKDKSPYKTAAAAVVNDPVGGDHTLYVQLSAEGLMVGGGTYMPATDQLTRLREAIDADRTGSELEGIVADIRRRGGEVGAHDELKTAPRGYRSDHPRIELLRYKGLIGWFEHPARAWLRTTKARDTVAEGWRSLGPLNAWLAANVGPSQG
jgi:uncharacterized protein (TIGR02453 family)